MTNATLGWRENTFTHKRCPKSRSDHTFALYKKNVFSWFVILIALCNDWYDMELKNKYRFVTLVRYFSFSWINKSTTGLEINQNDTMTKTKKTNQNKKLTFVKGFAYSDSSQSLESVTFSFSVTHASDTHYTHSYLYTHLCVCLYVCLFVYACACAWLPGATL